MYIINDNYDLMYSMCGTLILQLQLTYCVSNSLSAVFLDTFKLHLDVFLTNLDQICTF